MNRYNKNRYNKNTTKIGSNAELGVWISIMIFWGIHAYVTNESFAIPSPDQCKFVQKEGLRICECVLMSTYLQRRLFGTKERKSRKTRG